MWALVVNPISGQGKGTTVGNHVAGYLNQRGVDFTIVSGNSSRDLDDHLRIFLENNSDCRGVIAVGGDGLRIPFHWSRRPTDGGTGPASG